MAQSVKLADDIMEKVRTEASLQSRSVAGQLTHWVKIGQAIESSSAFDYENVRAALAGEVSPDALTAEEQAVWFDKFHDAMTAPTPEEEVFFANRRKQGLGVGGPILCYHGMFSSVQKS